MPVTSYFMLDGEIVGEKTAGQARLDYVPDALGSVAKTVDQSAAVDYAGDETTPYGQVDPVSASAPRFTWVGTLGYQNSVGAGMPQGDYYVRARFYGSPSGRWTTLDPLWPEEQAYGYVEGNPTTWADPSGMQGLRRPDGLTALSPQEYADLIATLSSPKKRAGALRKNAGVRTIYSCNNDVSAIMIGPGFDPRKRCKKKVVIVQGDIGFPAQFAQNSYVALAHRFKDAGWNVTYLAAPFRKELSKKTVMDEIVTADRVVFWGHGSEGRVYINYRVTKRNPLGDWIEPTDIRELVLRRAQIGRGKLEEVNIDECFVANDIIYIGMWLVAARKVTAYVTETAEQRWIGWTFMPRFAYTEGSVLIKNDPLLGPIYYPVEGATMVPTTDEK